MGLTEKQKDKPFGIYDEKDYNEKVHILVYQNLSIGWIENKWYELCFLEKDYILIYQNLSYEFIENKWNELNFLQKIFILYYQKNIPLEFIKEKSKEVNLDYKQLLREKVVLEL